MVMGLEHSLTSLQEKEKVREYSEKDGMKRK